MRRTCFTMLSVIPREGRKFRLEQEGKSISLIGIWEPDEGEEGEEIDLRPPNGTRLVFKELPRLRLRNGETEELQHKEGLFCQVELHCHDKPFALMFPHRILLLDWFMPGQEVLLLPGQRNDLSGNHHYDRLSF